MKLSILAALAAVIAFAPVASAQTSVPVPVVAPVAAAAAPAAKAKLAPNCFRLPLSDVAFGTEGATKYAREKLAEYAEAERKKRKWPDKPLVKSAETVSCEVYLNLGPVGTEYRCLVTATFCQK
ncbi:MAG: hypothetical protein ABL904_00775 [Hyphomicrobiaceae bacterium]